MRIISPIILPLVFVAAVASAAAPSSAHAGWLDSLFGNDEKNNPDDVSQPGELPDFGEGHKNAPVLIIEYASLTCPHCALFHNSILPELRSKFIDNQQVRIVLREFPLDPLATAAAMIARCVAGDPKSPDAELRFTSFTSLLFKHQSSWARHENPLDPLLKLAQQAGLGKNQFNSCLNNEDLLQKINQTAQRAQSRFNVNSTPSIFINGNLVPPPRRVQPFLNSVQEHLN